MASIPSSALAGAAVSAFALADIVEACAARLPLAAGAALAARRVCAGVRRVGAPRIGSREDVAALGATLVAALQAAARATPADDAATLLYEAAAGASVAYPITASPVLTREYALARALAAGVEAACLGEAFLAEARSDFPDRVSATQARARIDAALTQAYDRIAGALGAEVAEALASVARETAGHLAQVATALRPAVRVEAGRSAPSTALAWALYGDPQRAPDLLARARCGTPLFMPPRFEALAPEA